MLWLHKKDNGKSKTKPLCSPRFREGSQSGGCMEEDLWWEGLVEHMCFEFGVGVMNGESGDVRTDEPR